ncbi:MAG: hypothetical protein LBH14_08745 [Desulfobulbaceae bacterium]|jgi:hypothetical protein|nr:hypothetical protein [Desulfobulbaceae bacterium]
MEDRKQEIEMSLSVIVAKPIDSLDGAVVTNKGCFLLGCAALADRNASAR